MLKEGWRYEHLGAGVYAVISGAHGFGTDALILADFASPKNGGKMCDMGTGCGIIPLFWASRGIRGEIYGVELQNEGFLQLSHAIEKSGLEGRITPICGDIRERSQLPAGGAFDLVTMNPPYKSADCGIKSSADAAKIARHEVCCNAQDVCNAAAYLLKYGGRVCLCYRPERLCEIMCKMSAAGLEPKRLRLVCRRKGDEPWLVLIEGRRGGKPGLRVMPTLFIQNEDGSDSAELLRILGAYREEVN